MNRRGSTEKFPTVDIIGCIAGIHITIEQQGPLCWVLKPTHTTLYTNMHFARKVGLKSIREMVGLQFATELEKRGYLSEHGCHC